MPAHYLKRKVPKKRYNNLLVEENIEITQYVQVLERKEHALARWQEE